ncbi:MAG: hypothetical protein ABI782_06775 [Anaerolineaceae bacterium]
MRRFSARLAKATRSVSEDSDASGQGLAEYALILAFVALVCIVALGTLGGSIASSPGFTTLVGAI